MPWVHDDQAGWHYVRKKEKRERTGTRRIIIEPNPAPAQGQPPAVELPGEVLGSEGTHASGDAGSDPSPGGDRVDPGLRPRPLEEAGEGRGSVPPAEEQRPPEGDAPEPRVRVAGDGLGRLLPGERYTKKEV